MNPHEEYLHNRLPEIDAIKASVVELNQLDLSKISIEELNSKINACFPILNFGETIWDSKYYIFRARRNFNNDFEPYNHVCNIGIPPSDITPFGRGNNEFDPIFYGSHGEDLPLFECCQNLTVHDKFEPQNFTVGIWKVKPNETLRLVPIIWSEDVHKVRSDFQNFSQESDKKQSEWLTSVKVIEGSKIIRHFFADQFAKAHVKSVDDYKISAWFTTMIKGMNKYTTEKFDGILYPSIANKYKDDNVAIYPSSLSKLELVKCFSVVAYNFDFEKGTLVKGIISEGSILNNGDIKWKEK
jgi:hypothetical protein